MFLRLLLVLALAGCGEVADQKARPSKQDRIAATEAKLSKTPEPRTYTIDGNQLKVIDVPVKDSTGHADIQRCFVWRDNEYKTASISCGQMPEIILSN